MLVSDLVTDIHTVLEQVPDAGNYAIAVARYLDPTRDQVEFMRIGAVHWDDDDEFFLVPEGLGEILDLSERHLTASELLHDLEAQTETHGFVAYVRAKITQLDDEGTVSLNLPLWGTGVHEKAALVYFYYGECPPESGEI